MYVEGIDYDIPPKHRKRKIKKSNHKHEYKGVLIKSDTQFGETYHYGEQCNICGKINNKRILETKRKEGSPFSIMLSQEEILDKYKDLKIVEKLTNQKSHYLRSI